MKTALKLLAIILGLSILSEAAPVTGRVRFVGRPPGTTVPTIVYAESLDAARTQPGRFTMMQKDKSFTPRVLAVPVGSTVSFPNNDSIFHNVFSLSRPGSFDLGLYDRGESKDLTFKTATTYRVFCNIHPQMSATILVVPTSYITEADNSGNYRLDLPAGRYRITAWSERAQAASTEITVGASSQSVAEISLDESKFVEVKHKNKFGQDYPKAAYDPKKN